ncbi:ATP-dependent helicase, partial [Patescibacteria group bacterium]|nr:ATP-dependent helicase [Patescibacteria group bacterium]
FERFDLDYYRPRANPTRFLKALLQHFSRVKDEMITPAAYLDYVESRQANADTAEGVASEEKAEELSEIVRLKEIANAYHLYQQILLENNAFDFADLVTYTIELFQQRPNILKKYLEQFKFILVDEFQDTNRAQYELIKLLARPKNNITVVGDDDQSIYKFRGASLSNILQFRSDFPGSKSVVLNQNYRSTKAILDTAYKLIQNNNPERLEVRENINKQLISNTEPLGQVEHWHFYNIDEEVRSTIQKIIDLKRENKCAWSDFCILVRANDSAEPFTTIMDRSNIPYKFMAMSGLYTKPIILDALAWMRSVDQPHNSPSIYRILSNPELGLLEHEISELTLYSRRKALSLWDTMNQAGSIIKLDSDAQTRIREILTILSQLQQAARRLPVNEFFVTVIKQSGIWANVATLSEAEQIEQNELLRQFYQRLRKFEASNDDKTLHHFLLEFDHERQAGEVGSLSQDQEAGPDVVNVMTVHGSKGLEFKYVFLVNLIEQRFPSQKRSEAIQIPVELLDEVVPETDQHIAEERRLFYVGLTRAKIGAYLMSADDYGGTRKRKISRFVTELAIQPKTNQASIVQETSQNETTPNPPIKPTTLSFTQIAAFSTCPLQYKFAHILKVPVFGRHSLSFGKTMHNTLHQFMKIIINQQDQPQASLFEKPTIKEIIIPTQDELLKIYNDQWIDEWYPSEEIKEEYREKGRDSLTTYRRELENNPPTIHSLEKGFTLKIGGVSMRGRIDRIDQSEDGFEIIDYKTGSPKDKLSWQDKRQLVLYQLAAETCFDPPLKIVKLTYHYLEDNSTQTFEATLKDKIKLEREVLETVEKLTSSNFEPTPGFHCGYCDFKDICEFAKE